MIADRLWPARTLHLGAAELVELAAEVLAQGGRFRFRVTGSSMRPALVAGDQVELAAVAPGQLSLGDVVLVRGPRPVLHRLVRIEPGADRITTRGDAADDDDPTAPLSDLIGRVVGVRRPWPVSIRGWAGRLKRLMLRG